MSLNTVIGDIQTNLPLKVWLVNQLNEKKFTGLEWLDKQKLLFKIIWVDQHKPDAKILEAICKAWARNKDGEENGGTFSKLKGRFRDALRNSNHIERVDQMSVQHLQTGNYQVYRFLSAQEVRGKKELKKKTSSDLTTQPLPSTQENSLQEIPLSDVMSVLEIQDDRENHQNLGYNQADVINSAVAAPDISMQDDFTHSCVQRELANFDPLAQVNVQPNSTIQRFNSMEEVVGVLGVSESDLSKFEVTLRYEKDVVATEVIDFAQGVAFCPVWQELADSAFQVSKLDYRGTNKNVLKVLELLQDGFALQLGSQGDLFGERFCRSHIYVFNCENDKESLRMKSKEVVCVFSILKYINFMIEYCFGKRKHRPECEAMLVLGSNPATILAPTFISLTMRPLIAEKLNEALGCSDNSLSLLFSDEQSLEFLSRNMDEIRNSQTPVIFENFDFL